jgi:hypothetical protein
MLVAISEYRKGMAEKIARHKCGCCPKSILEGFNNAILGWTCTISELTYKCECCNSAEQCLTNYWLTFEIAWSVAVVQAAAVVQAVVEWWYLEEVLEPEDLALCHWRTSGPADVADAGDLYHWLGPEVVEKNHV